MGNKSLSLMHQMTLLIVAAAIAACAGPAAAPAGNGFEEAAAPAASSVEVRLIGWQPTDPTEEDVTREIMNRCGVDYDLNVNYGEYWERLSIMFAAGEEIDIAYINTSHISAFAQQDSFLRLEEFGTIQRDEFIGPTIDAFTMANTTFGIPKDANALALFYNAALFDELGLEYPADYWSWYELRESAQIITKFTGMPGLALPLWPSTFAPFVYQNGGRIMTEDFSDTWIDSWEAIEAGQFYVEALWEGWAVDPQEVGGTSDAFGRGDLAMVLATDAMIPYLARNYPELYYRAVQLPAGPANVGNILYATAYAIPRTSRNPGAAMEAINCLTSEENQSLFLDAEVALPSRHALEGHPFIQGNPAANAVYNGIWFATPYNWGPHHQEIDAMIREALERAYRGEMSVEESFTIAADEIRSIIWQ